MPHALIAESLEERLAKSHRSALLGLQKRLLIAEDRLRRKEADPDSYPSDLKRERRYVEELRRAEESMRSLVGRYELEGLRA